MARKMGKTVGGSKGAGNPASYGKGSPTGGRSEQTALLKGKSTGLKRGK